MTATAWGVYTSNDIDRDDLVGMIWYLYQTVTLVNETEMSALIEIVSDYESEESNEKTGKAETSITFEHPGKLSILNLIALLIIKFQRVY